MAGISYDSGEILRHFTGRVGIHYPLLSDSDSSVIRSFGIFNSNVPRDHAWYGVPFPGIYIVDAGGRVQKKYFEENYRNRFTGDAILTREFGLAGGRRTETRTRHLTLTTYLSGDRERRPGSRITLVAEVSLQRKMHLYAPGVKGYHAVSFTIEEKPEFTVHPTEFPRSEILYLPAIKERVPVYTGKVRFTRDITLAAGSTDGGPVVKPGAELELAGIFEYQACDDKACYLTQKIPVKFQVQVGAQDRSRVPEPLRRKPPP
ncbi:MAG: redoxin domain-containing protein [Acidobacteria bacterium]|nr:redoxin domain-containing protein [Acidobacteriota bacterium]